MLGLFWMSIDDPYQAPRIITIFPDDEERMDKLIELMNAREKRNNSTILYFWRRLSIEDFDSFEQRFRRKGFKIIK